MPLRYTFILALACAAAYAQEPTPLQGTVIFSRSAPAESDATPEPTPTAAQEDKLPTIPITDAERADLTIASWDLDVHLTPAKAHLEARAGLVLRNTSAAPLTRIPLQLSSTLRWQSLSLNGKAAAFTQSPIATDTDHTGYAQEAVLTLPAPLAPGASVTLTAFYAGDIPASAARLELIGTPPRVATATDWDRISADSVGSTEAPTALRGFGNVLWYPCAAPVARLGEGNRLFELIGQTKLKESTASIRLRLTVVYTGEPPALAIFNGHAQPLEHAADTDDDPIALTHGIATAEFAAQPLGFRAPNLFLVDLSPTRAAGQLLSVIAAEPEAIAPYAGAAKLVQPLLADWLGPAPTTPLLLLDHPGQTFEDGALLVTPLDAGLSNEQLAPKLVHGLTHAWMPSSHPWIDEGLAQFMNLLWTERTRGRADAILELERQANVIALAEPDLSASGNAPLGEPLIAASSEVFLRAKAAAVWWQLRDILGDQMLQRGLRAYRHGASLDPAFDHDPRQIQKTLELASNRKLDWFFDDWVYRDRGLPDLTIVSVTPHPLPAVPGKSAGYLVAVEVRNDGDAACEVPVTIHAGDLTASERLRIPAHASASTRIPFQSTPQSVAVNDGSVPELRTPHHTRSIAISTQ